MFGKYGNSVLFIIAFSVRGVLGPLPSRDERSSVSTVEDQEADNLEDLISAFFKKFEQ